MFILSFLRPIYLYSANRLHLPKLEVAHAVRAVAGIGGATLHALHLQGTSPQNGSCLFLCLTISPECINYWPMKWSGLAFVSSWLCCDRRYVVTRLWAWGFHTQFCLIVCALSKKICTKRVLHMYQVAVSSYMEVCAKHPGRKYLTKKSDPSR